MKKLRIALIGDWGHYSTVLSEAAGIEGAEVVALAKAWPDEDPEHIREECPIAANAVVYDDHRKMLAEVRPHVAVISTRLDLIGAQAVDAARAGCHLICEKPLAIEHATLHGLYEAVRGSGVQCIAMLGNREQPALAAARSLIERGDIGRVVLVNARKSYKFGVRPDWFGRRASYGGTIPWIGIHALDFIEAATGATFTTVAAMQSNAAHPERPECEDNCVLVLELSGGAHATASVDYLRPSAAPTHGDDWVRVVGTRGVIEAHMARGTCSVVTENKPLREVPVLQGGGYFGSVLRQLRDSPRDLEPVTARSFMLTETCLCARDAADRRQVVDIPSGPWARRG